MYQPRLTLRDRAGPLAAVVLVHLALGYALLHRSGAGARLAQKTDIAIFDVFIPPPPVEPPPPPPPPPVEQRQVRQPAKPNDSEGAASPKNIVSKASEVAVPKPQIVLPAPSPVIAAVTPSTGTNATNGASDIVGPGTGAGGTGNGSGSGGAGSGNGGGGRGGAPVRASVIERTKLTSRDYPIEAIRAWPPGARVFVAVRVQLDGHATDCKINRSSGIAQIDADTCRLVMGRVRFVPARDENGRPTVEWYGYVQEPAGRW